MFQNNSFKFFQIQGLKIISLKYYWYGTLLSSRYQDVFVLLVPSCCDKSGTSCYHLVTRLMTVKDLLQVVPTRLIQAVRNKLLRACCHQLVTCRRYQTCWNNLLQVCWPHQPCYKMITTCSRLVNNNEGEHILLTSCEILTYTRKNEQLVTSLQTSCYKSVHKLSTSCVRTACSQFVVTSLEQAVNNL